MMFANFVNSLITCHSFNVFLLCFFGNAKNSNKGINGSYSIIGCPCCNKCKIEANCTTFFALFLHTICNMGNNTFIATSSQQFSSVCHVCNFSSKTNPFFQINPNILISFLLNYMLTKIIPFENKQLIFPFSGGIVKDNRWIQKQIHNRKPYSKNQKPHVNT